VGGKGLLVAWVDSSLLICVGICVGIYLLRMEPKAATIVSVATSVCGSSAAAATAKSLNVPETDGTVNTVIAVMSLFSTPLIPLLPRAKEVFSEYVVGAWIGGAINSTGPVSAAGAIAGDAILRIALVIKMTQNLLIVPICMILAVVCEGKQVKELWQVLVKRFPKFVWGFLLTSLVVTLIPADEDRTLFVNNSFVASEWISLMGFVVIGFELNVKEILANSNDRKTLILYLVMQAANLGTTLGWAMLAYPQ
jgi:uncharacterized membrane protein YadS